MYFNLNFSKSNPLGGVFDKHLADEILELWTDVSVFWEDEGLSANLVVQGEDDVVMERHLSSHQGVQCDAERPDISSLNISTCLT